ncbi:MAG: toxic anion resistance protein [Paracoccaceae bacterium]|nr:toxic anion resistance protein [Paracoccaceae bacterium]MDG1370694.1 toxic anion resistance protein [Paracoccaceae bacterium]
MSETIQAKAQTLLVAAEELSNNLLVMPAADIKEADKMTPEEQTQVTGLLADLDMNDSQSIIKFGSAAQTELQAISSQMLDGVRNKDVGPAGASLREMVTNIRGFDAEELDPNRKQSWWERLFGKARPVAEFIAKYETVRGQIDRVSDELLEHESILLKDIKSLDKLYESSLDFYNDLALFIAAGEEKLRLLDEEEIPAMAKVVENAPEEEGVLRAQELRDLRAARDDLERRVYDLKLTRQVTMQSLPSIRLVQENDKSLVNKINSTLVNTLPLWETQLAQAVTIFRSREAAKTVKEATDLTNDLLQKNAENLQAANREVRKEMERGVFDIEAVKSANRTLIDTIEESLQIADEGKARRAAAESELQTMEEELKTTLASAKSSRPAATEAPTA